MQILIVNKIIESTLRHKFNLIVHLQHSSVVSYPDECVEVVWYRYGDYEALVTGMLHRIILHI